MTKKKKKIDINIMIAIGVLLASIGTLIVSSRQSNIMHEQTSILFEQTNVLLEQTKTNTWPHLTIGLWKGSDEYGKLTTYKFFVDNKGVGPAIIEKVRISYDGSYASSWDEFYEIIQVPDSIHISHSNQNIHNRVLASNETLNLIDWSTDKGFQTPLSDYIHPRADKIKIEICYKSIHGETWSVTRSGFQSDLESNDRTDRAHCNYNNEKMFIQ